MSEHSRWEMSPKRIFFKYFCWIKFTFQTLQTDIFWTLSWLFSCDYSFWLRDLKFCMCIKDSINKTCWKNGKDLSNGAPKIKLWNHTKKTHFPVFAKNFRRPWMKLNIFFCQFPNPWTLRVSGMGGYTSKCEKKSKSLHPSQQSFTEARDQTYLLLVQSSCMNELENVTCHPKEAPAF